MVFETVSSDELVSVDIAELDRVRETAAEWDARETREAWARVASRRAERERKVAATLRRLRADARK